MRALDSAVALFVLGWRMPDLVGAASAALEAGLDSPALRRLAGLDPSQTLEANDMFSRVLDELRVPLPSKVDAVRYLACESACEITAGRVDPLAGAERIRKLSIEVDDPLPELDTFKYAAYEAPDRPEDRQIFVDGVMEAARDLCSRRR